MAITVDKQLRRAVDGRTGLAVTFLGTGIPQEMTAFFRFEMGGRTVDFTAGHTLFGAAQSLRTSKGLPPSQRLELLRALEELQYTIDIDPLGLRTAAEIDNFVAVFRAAAATVGEPRTIRVVLSGQNATPPKRPVFRHIRAMLSKD